MPSEPVSYEINQAADIVDATLVRPIGNKKGACRPIHVEMGVHRMCAFRDLGINQPDFRDRLGTLSVDEDDSEGQ